jgi:hypothetical protein
MDLTRLFDQVRDHYVEQFEAFVDTQNDTCIRGHAEVKFQVSEKSGLHRRLSIVDFVKNDDRVEAIAFVPERLLQFDKVSGTLGRMSVSVEALRWDNAVLHFNSPTPLQLDSWFEQWFDPDDRRHDPNAKLGSVIHSLSVQPGLLTLDLGTAPGEALWRLLQELERAGVDQVVINNDAGHRY